VDVYGPTIFPTSGAAASVLITNRPVDLFQYNGRGEFIINVATNGAVAGTASWTLYSSPDTTNWTAVANYALISGTTSIITTNGQYGINTNGLGGVLATNFMLMPYSLTTPNATVSFWNTPYPSYLLFTNTGAVTLSPQGSTVVGVNVTDNGRYWEGVFTGTGGGTSNFVGSVTFIGTPKNYIQP
jgi:hypothetical protein